MKERQILICLVAALIALLSTAAVAQTQIGVSGANGAVAFTYDGGKQTTTVAADRLATHALPASSQSAGISTGATTNGLAFKVVPHVSPVPEPATLAMLGSGLLATGSLFRFRRRK